MIIQQQAPGWFASAADAEYAGTGSSSGCGTYPARRRPGLGHDASTWTATPAWTHAFTARRLDDAELTAVLAGSGLRLDRYLTDDHSWLRAVPA